MAARLHLECVKAGWGDMRQLQCDGAHLLGGVRFQLRGVVVVADFGGGLAPGSENGLGLPAADVAHQSVGTVPLVADRHGLPAGVMMCAGISALLSDTSESFDDVMTLVENA